jgi:hypothetical protein
MGIGRVDGIVEIVEQCYSQLILGRRGHFAVMWAPHKRFSDALLVAGRDEDSVAPIMVQCRAEIPCSCGMGRKGFAQLWLCMDIDLDPWRC